MNRVLVLAAAFAAALAVTAVSAALLYTTGKGVAPLDKGAFVYARANDLLKKGDQDGAINAMVAVVSNYSDSPVSEKAYRDLISLYAKKGDTAKSRYYTGRLLRDFPDVKDAASLRGEMQKLGVETLFSPRITEDSMQYVVKKGDTLYAVARRFNTTVDLIKKVNRLQSDNLAIGQKLKIVVAKFSILVEKSRNILTLMKDGEPLKTYVVSTGTDNSTPVGVFKIEEKMIKPVWYKTNVKVLPDSEEYELGTRWMGISLEGYGIHGTKDESTIGQQVTAGCVRMKNSDVEELFEIVPGGTEVTIVD